MNRTRLTIIIPCYNEEKTIKKVIQSIYKLTSLRHSQVIVVDDGSTDTSKQIILSLQHTYPLLALFHTKNRGKGAAIRTALNKAYGTWVIVQDADLECNPKDIVRLMSFAKTHRASAVFGTRNQGTNTHLYPHYSLGGKLVTLLGNALFGLRLTDIGCGYKLIKRSLLTRMSLTENGFGVCAEMTAHLALMDIPIQEMPISYHPRTFKDGKKIRMHDGIRLGFVLIGYKVRAYR